MIVLSLQPSEFFGGFFIRENQRRPKDEKTFNIYAVVGMYVAVRCKCGDCRN